MKNETNKEDRRVLRTRRLLKEALLELINSKTYDEISIRDITDQADIGYATFFRHYDGKDDLMLEIYSGTIEEIESLPDRHGDRYFEQEGYLLFQHVMENQALYRGILDSKVFAQKLRKHLSDMVQMHLIGHSDRIPSGAIPIEIAATHMVSSILGLIDWWLTSGTPYPIERMAMVYERLVIHGTWQALRSEEPKGLPWEDRE